MSAYLCCPSTIGPIAAHAVSVEGVCPEWMDKTVAAEQIAALLAKANVASIHARYPDTVEGFANSPGPIDLTTPEAYVADCVKAATEEHDHSPESLYGAVRCLDYQSCEVNGWGATSAGVLLAQLLNDFRQAGIESEGWGL